MDQSERHLRLVLETSAAVNSTLDLDEQFQLIAARVSEALDADACFVYLYDEHAHELVMRASVGTQPEALTLSPRMRVGEGITGTAAAERAPISIARDAHLDPRFKRFPNLHEEQYQSILAVPVLARERLEGAINVRTLAPRHYSEAEVDLLLAIAGQVAQAIENAKLYDQSRRRVAELEALARISESVSESLYFEETLKEIVATTMSAVHANGARVELPGDGGTWRRGSGGAHVERTPLRWKGREVGELVCERDTPFTDEERTLLMSVAHQAAVALEQGRSVMRGVLAKEIHHRVKNNLQTVASMLRLQARSTTSDPRQALEDSVNRILAIAAVHEVLMERREDDVDLADLVERLRRMIVQGLGSGKQVNARLGNASLAGDRATAVALVFSELLQNALEHGGTTVEILLTHGADVVTLIVADDGPGVGTAPAGTGLSIVQALVADELKGTLVIESGPGTRAVVRFAA